MQTTQTAKHTPGPWHVIDHAFPGLSHKDRPIADDAGDTILEVRGYGVAESIRDANARLIAAAPDLLDACEALLPHVEAMIERANPAHEDTSHYSDQTAVRLARAAIAKANGQA